MGTAGDISHVLLRVVELCCAVIVLGLDGRLLWVVGQAGVYRDARLIYTIVVASLGAAFSLVLILPIIYAFYAFPMDFVLFVMWFVAFVLMEALTGVNTCESFWYWNYWGYYWGGFWRHDIDVYGPWDISWSGCSSWRAVIAFSFIAAMAHLASFGLGFYETMKHRYNNRSEAHESSGSGPGILASKGIPSGPGAGASNVGHDSMPATAASGPLPSVEP
ncbi:hypothetical protein RB595_002136 [Gaeumannomyces hyphopodioides]